MTIGALTSPVRTSSLKASPALRPLAVAEPADPRRQALERDALLGHRDPAVEPGVVGEELQDRAVGPGDVGRVAGQRDPAERPAALAELRPDEGRHEARVVEGVGDAGLLRLGAQVVAVVEDDRAGALEGEHRPDVGGHRAARSPLVLVGQGGAQLEGVGERDLGRHVAAERVVGRGLVGDEVEPLAGRGPGGLDLGGVADERDAQRLAGRGGLARPAQAPRPDRRSAGRRSRCRAVGGPAPRRPRWRGRRPRSSSRPAAGRRPSRRGRRSASRSRAASRRSAGGPPRRTSRTCPAGSPASRCRSTTRRSSGRTSSGRPARARGSPPRSPTCRRGSSWRSGPAAPTGGSGRRRPACPTGRAASRRRRGRAARGRSRRRPPTTAPRARCRRRRRDGRGPRRPPGRGCS